MTTTNQQQHDHLGGPRMNLAKLVPDVYKAMVALDRAASKGVDPVLAELVKIRGSQLNHCAFCIDMHTKDARAAGEREDRIYLLNAWEEATGYYTEKERAALALTEAVTVLTDGFVPDEVYERAAAHFEETELAQLISLIVAINNWNRFAVTSRATPGVYQPGQHA
ncbi:MULTISPECIES: carboxymuconolactone decarboxylase family protein [Streptomyces]|uniref:Carboxymuconolactone decarboxylase family protein n=1 Tax=Streptomyces lycii TaxID=2654337 RepID=A0ABQ7FKZ7_9ACTN|nr:MULTISPECIES: carboxymuconolactone decarboxylase family protein [Streptomyces]KAF4409293.1 carboxymuconolactone decarboxylase family protein [Streptomyces lycii]PGH48604.1 4-carboxymuconolactone decarboxylase [Streptomyces sp. Ru87]